MGQSSSSIDNFDFANTVHLIINSIPIRNGEWKGILQTPTQKLSIPNDTINMSLNDIIKSVGSTDTVNMSFDDLIKSIGLDNQVQATFWEKNNESIKIVISRNFWPCHKSDPDGKFIYGHHYFNFTSNIEKNNFYDLENKEWINGDPSQKFLDLFQKWDKFISAVEADAGETTTVITQKGEIKHSKETREKMTQKRQQFSKNSQHKNSSYNGQSGGYNHHDQIMEKLDILSTRLTKLENALYNR